MSSKVFYGPTTIMTAVALTGDATSQVVLCKKLDNISFQATTTGSPTGTLSVQVSNNYSINVDGSVRNAGTWDTMTTPPAVAVSSGTPSDIFIDVNQTGAYAIRLAWTNNASASGTMTAIAVGKGL